MDFLEIMGLKEPAVRSLKIAVKDCPADRPEFKREYKSVITNNIEITVYAKTWIVPKDKRHYSGELKQPDGRWVFFEPERPADKILDRDLLPDINAFCKQVIEDDQAYFKSLPDTFTDVSGQCWRKC